MGVVVWCEGVMYLTSPGCPTDIGLQWARLAILVTGKGRGGMFLFLLFLHFHSCSSFFSVSVFQLFYYLFCLFSPFFWEMTQNDPQVDVLLNRNTISQWMVLYKFNVFSVVFQTLIIRDWWFCMIISVMFEILEYTLEHQLPNFSECWWDHVSSIANAPCRQNRAQ